MAKILAIEDEADLRFIIVRTLQDAGHHVEQADSVPSARELIKSTDFDLILTDVILGNESGLTLVAELRSDGFDGVIVVMTAYTSVENAVHAMRQGADDYLQKPLSLDELDIQVNAWLERRQMERRLRLYQRLDETRQAEEQILGESPKWIETLGLAQRFAQIPLPPADAPSSTAALGENLPCILLLGETGVGKGLVARFIHNHAPCAEKPRARAELKPPFVHVNCAALPGNLVESELFGHEKGAFTDAREARPGLFEMADGGTIFLDEISEMPLDLQAKLLLVVEQGTYRRVGGTKERRVRARVIAASNQALEKRAEEGKFRKDLFYRLNAFTISIPPLRQRGDDAVIIARAMVNRYTRQYARPPMKLTPDAEMFIRKHPWPGNVRELINALQRAVMLSDSDTIAESLLGTIPTAKPKPSERKAPTSEQELVFDFANGSFHADKVERALILQALAHTKGNISRAAKLIGMQRSSLRYRIERLGLETYLQEVAQP